MIVGSAGYFTIPCSFWAFLVFAHIGTLGVMGSLGCAAAGLAKKKYLSYWRAFFWGFLIPIIVGIVAVLIFLMGKDGALYCGGLPSLIVAGLVILFFALTRKRPLPDA